MENRPEGLTHKGRRRRILELIINKKFWEELIPHFP
jgi:hypothetical protein